MRKRYDEEHEDGNEPTFSIHDFKKWLKGEGVDPDDDLKQESTEEVHKENMKEKFKENFKEKLRKKRKKKAD